MSRKIVLLVVAAALVLAGVLAALASWRASTTISDFAPSVEEALARRLGGALSAESSSVEGMGRIVLRGVSHETNGRDARITAEARRLAIEPGLLALIAGRVELDRVELDGVSVLVARRAPPTPQRPTPVAPTPAPAPPAATSPPASPAAEREPERLELDVHELAVRDASLRVADADGVEQLRAEGLAVTLDDLHLEASGTGATTRIEELSATGVLEADIVATRAGVARALRADVAWRDDELRLDALSHASAVGDATGELVLSLQDVPPRLLSGSLAIERLDLRTLVAGNGAGHGAATGAGAGTTPRPASRASLTIELTGSAPGLAAPTGRGEVQVEAGRLPDFPVLSGVEASLRRLSLRDAQHDPVVARFTLDGSRAVLEPFVVRAADVQAEIEGTVGLEGNLALDVVLRAARERVDLRGAPRVVLDALTLEPGLVVLPLDVRGTAGEPRISPDVDAMVEGARAAGRTIDRAELRREIARLFDGA